MNVGEKLVELPLFDLDVFVNGAALTLWLRFTQSLDVANFPLFKLLLFSFLLFSDPFYKSSVFFGFLKIVFHYKVTLSSKKP